MTSPMKRKGYLFEQDVLSYLKENLSDLELFLERRMAGSSTDIGDIYGIPGWVLECKNQKSFDPTKWWEQTKQERKKAKVAFGAVIAKRKAPNHKPPDSLVIMDLEQFVRILRTVVPSSFRTPIYEKLDN